MKLQASFMLNMWAATVYVCLLSFCMLTSLKDIGDLNILVLCIIVIIVSRIIRDLPSVFSVLSSFITFLHPLSQNKINSRKNVFIVQKCQTCVVVAKQTVTNNIYMEEVCISAASQSTACLSLYQSKDNEGSPHCNYPTMSLSVTSHKYE